MTTANLRAPHDLGSIVGYAWRIYQRYFITLFLIALIVAPVEMLTTIIVRRINDDATAQLAAIYLQIPSVLVALIASAGVFRAVNDIADAVAPEAGRSIDTGLQKFSAVLTTQLLVVVRILPAIFAAPLLGLYWLYRRDATIDGRRDWYFAVVPFALCIYLAVRWYFAPNAVVLHDKRNWSALDDSADVVRRHWWRTLGVLIVISLVQLGPVVVATASVLAAPIIDGAISGLITALVLPFGATAQTLLYYDLKARSALDSPVARIDDPESDVPREGP